MLRPSTMKALQLQAPSSTMMKMKTLIHHVYKIIGTFSKAKSLIIKIVREYVQQIQFISSTKKNKVKNKILFGSFRLHYNWCSSSHVFPAPPTNSIQFSPPQAEEDSGDLSGYLEWLEEKKHVHVNEIDRLADIFIANCHEKFRLEKQESYRRFQEMLARSA